MNVDLITAALAEYETYGQERKSEWKAAVQKIIDTRPGRGLNEERIEVLSRIWHLEHPEG